MDIQTDYSVGRSHLSAGVAEQTQDEHISSQGDITHKRGLVQQVPRVCQGAEGATPT